MMPEEEKDKYIKKSIRALKRTIKNIDANQKTYATMLIDKVAFMDLTLFELQEVIKKNGAVELFEQGKQKMMREAPSAKIYNTMIKNYSTIIKILAEMSPSKESKDELINFLNKKRDRHSIK